MLSQSNGSFVERIEEELPGSTFYWLLIAIASAMTWVVYLTYYNSRVLGLILTFLLNKFVKFQGHIKFGSFTFSILSGKLMFRDVHLITEDFSIRVQFGWAIFRWWRPYAYREITEDLSHSETRLSLFLDGLEFHVYNRSESYAHLEKLFGLESIVRPTDKPPDEGPARRVSDKGLPWRDLVPVIKADLTSCRFVFGNYLVPSTLILSFEEAHLVYTTKPASTPFDQFMHTVKSRLENIRVMLVPSPKYKGPVDEPPRYMGEGFVVLQSNDVNVYYYMDEAGVVPHEPEIVQLADGEVVVRRTWPCLGMDIKCGKGTNLNYGPWADRQRESLWNIFYPSSYEAALATKVAEPGELRQFKSFEFRMNIISDATIDILFTKSKETQAIHMNTGPGTYIEAVIPWMTEEWGYTSRINGQLLIVDATTSLQFRSFIECETLGFDVRVEYSTLWNDHQDWEITLTACKTTACLIFQHKYFVSDLMDDWSTKSVPDLYHFVPYTWHFNLEIKEFEVITLANEYNWIDTSSQNPENAHIAFCGETFELSFQLPFIDYLPTLFPVKIFVRGESIDCRLFLPESNTSRHTVISLAKNMKLSDRDGHVTSEPFGYHKENKWRNVTQNSAGWIDCWTTDVIALSITYTYHPMAVFLPAAVPNQQQIIETLPTPDKEEALLFPLKPKTHDMYEASLPPEDFDPAQMEPDLIRVELEIGSSSLCLFGPLLHCFLHVKENYLGEDQTFTDFYTTPCAVDNNDTQSTFTQISMPDDMKTTSKLIKAFDERSYRPLSVKVSLTVHDVHGHLIRNCSEADPPCPSIFVERIGFELDKSYQETKLQLLLSPVIVIATDRHERPTEQAHLHEGHLALSGLQVRGHAMFSHKDLPLESETLEYSWMVEAVIGDISGKLSTPQLQNIVEFLMTAVMLVEDAENHYQHPRPYNLCHHMVAEHHCTARTNPAFPCPPTDEIKYRMSRVSVDSINIFLVEGGSALSFQVHPVRLGTCNLHGPSTRSGITGVIELISFKQYISLTGLASDNLDTWLEAGQLSLGPIHVEAAMALPNPELHIIQDLFLRNHDAKTNRLCFLWDNGAQKFIHPAAVGKCGCCGGCYFFGSNRNGLGFFHPRRSARDTHSAAVFQLFPEGSDPGFGQSLLHKDKLLFDVEPFPITPEDAGGFPFIYGHVNGVTSPETTTTSVTILDDRTPQRHLSGGTTSNASTIEKPGPSKHFSYTDRDSVFDGSRDSTLRSKNSDSASIPSSMLPESPVTEPYDTDRTLTSPDSGSIPSYSRSPSSGASITRMHHQSGSSHSQIDSPYLGERRDSRVSMLSYHSVGSTFTRCSSVTTPDSPVKSYPDSLSSEGHVFRLQSAGSLESENYFSAEEGSSLRLGGSLDGLSHNSTTIMMNDVTDYNLEDESDKTITRGQSLSDAAASIFQEKERSPLHHSSSVSLTSSTLSYMSAESDATEVGSQEVPEDFSLVDLHGQINQPITRSPVLMACYSSHLTQLQCANWTAPAPGHQFNSQQSHQQHPKHIHSYQSLHSSFREHSMRTQSTSAGPQFKNTRRGFAMTLMRSREEMLTPPSATEGVHLRQGSEQWKLPGRSGETEAEEDKDQSEDLLTENRSKTMAIFQIKDSINILLTPLLLESMQRYVEAVIPALSTLHPAAIIDYLHGRCLDRLKQQNKLTPTQAQQRNWQDLPDATLGKESSISEAAYKVGPDAARGEAKTACFQALFSLPKIHLCILQASIVEEVISFSALDNIHELSCVSLLALSLDGINCQVMCNNHSCKSAPAATIPQSASAATAAAMAAAAMAASTPPAAGRSSVSCVPRKGRYSITNPPRTASVSSRGRIGRASSVSITSFTMRSKPAPVNRRSVSSVPPDTELDKVSSEVRREEMIGKLHIGKIHCQLRRLLKNSSYSDQVILTAIPEYRSKVMFFFDSDRRSPGSTTRTSAHYDTSSMSSMRTYPHDTTHSTGSGTSGGGSVPLRSPKQKPSRQSSRDSRFPDIINSSIGGKADSTIGFIMFECGIEDITLTGVRRIGYQNSTSTPLQEKMAEIEKTLRELQESSKYCEENESSTAGGMKSKSSTDPITTLRTELGKVQHSVDSLSSWDSRMSIPSSMTSLPSVTHIDPLVGDASSIILKFSTVWFNFAAPPPIPSKRIVNFTRLDWNLLSTATPAINAWMNPSDRLMGAINQLIRTVTHHTSSVMACVMTEALEVQNIHMPHKSKFSKITTLSRTLQQDPSCQLLNVLHKYLLKAGLVAVTNAIHADTIPQIITIQKGILALTRQWKNVLYMPQFADMGFKSKKQDRPYTVKFVIPEEDEEDEYDIDCDDTSVTQIAQDVVDEKTSLLQAEGGSITPQSVSVPTLSCARSTGQVSSMMKEPGPSTDHVSTVSISSSATGKQKKFSTLLAQMAVRGRGIKAAAGLGASMPPNVLDSPERSQQQHLSTAPLKRNGSNFSFLSGADSTSSLDQVPGLTPQSTPIKVATSKQSILKTRNDDGEDLYRWMASQQDHKHFPSLAPEQSHQSYSLSSAANRQDSLLTAFTSAWSQDDSHTDVNSDNCTMATSIQQLANAQILFKPFLQSIGLHVESIRSSAVMKKFGGNLSMQASLDTLKIEIVDLEQETKKKGKARPSEKAYSSMYRESSKNHSFLCEGFNVNITMKDVVDFEKQSSVSHGEDGRLSQNIQFAMHKLEAKPTTTHVTFLVECRTVMQHVNMPLLRLVHQFITMVSNINDTRVELKQNRSSETWVKTHRKQHSKDSSSSTSTQHSDASKLSKTDATTSATVPWLSTPVAPICSPTSVSASGSDTSASALLGKATIQDKPPSIGVKESTQKKPKASTEITNRLSFTKARPEKLQFSSVRKTATKIMGKHTKNNSKESDSTANMATPPQSLNLSDSIAIDMADDTSSPALAEKTIVDEIRETTPQCWRTLYHLLDLYSTMPEAKTINRHPELARLSIIQEEPDRESGSLKPMTSIKDEEIELGDVESGTAVDGEHVSTATEHDESEKWAGGYAQTSFNKTSFKQSIYIGESMPIVVFGLAKIRSIKILAVLSGLKLEAELQNVHASGTYKEKVKGFLKRKTTESSATGYVGQTTIRLLEGIPSNLQTVVTVNIGACDALGTSMIRRGKDHNSALFNIGHIAVDIPQHPVALHGMMTRSSREISTTLQEFRWPSARASKSATIMSDSTDGQTPSQPTDAVAAEEVTVRFHQPPTKPPTSLMSLHIHLRATLEGWTLAAALLPSLRAQHKTDRLTISGMTGKKAKFTVDIPSHCLSFRSKVTTPESSIPSSASIDLPPIHMAADLRHHRAASSGEACAEGHKMKEGPYMNVLAEVGLLEHSLTTDLLNHLVFVQKVFMKEVNELVQKVSGSDQPVPLWIGGGKLEEKTPRKSILYSLLMRFKGLQITATTPTSSAVRLETEPMDLEVSNRVQSANLDLKPKIEDNEKTNEKAFIRAQVVLNLALGQLLKNPMFEEAEPEFQTLAFFKTKIDIRNALPDEMIPGQGEEQEALLITLSRPIVLAQPLAFDKAVLVWLNYRHAYEYWSEQRLALNREVQTATRRLMDRIPTLSPGTGPAFSTLFLQLTVNDMGICVPLNAACIQGQQSGTSRITDAEPGPAVVLTVVNTQISACSCGSLVSKGKFTGFCLRFADDFETSWDDWKPDARQGPNMNVCMVPEGTYEVCSRTLSKHGTAPCSNAKWILNILWEMQGIDVQLDTNIGKGLSALFSTLTALAGDQADNDTDDIDGDLDLEGREVPTIQLDLGRKPSSVLEGLPSFIFDTTIDPKQRARLIEAEMNDQARVVQDLKQLGASHSTIEVEARKLEELQALIFNDFRRDVLNRIKKQGERASALKDKLGLGYKPAHMRSKSFGGQQGRRRSSRLESEHLPSNMSNIDYTKRSATLSYPAAHVQFKSRDSQSSSSTSPESPDPLSTTIDDPTMIHTLMEEPSVLLRHDTRMDDDDVLNPVYKAQSLQDMVSSSSDSSSGDGADGEIGGIIAGNLDENRWTRRTHDENLALYPMSNVLGRIGGQLDGVLEEQQDDDDADVDDIIDDDVVYLQNVKHRMNGLSDSLTDFAFPPLTHQPSTPSLASNLSAGGSKVVPEPSVDFELDIKVFIDSGRCVLHPKETLFKDTEDGKKHGKKDRSMATDPSIDRKTPMKKQESVGGKKASQSTSMLVENTMFCLPSVDVKVHYNSKTSSADIAGASGTTMGAQPQTPTGATNIPPPSPLLPSYMVTPATAEPDGLLPLWLTTQKRGTTGSGTGGSGVKRANLYAWLSLQSLPEMVVGPSILDFLEQALEAIPISQSSHHKKGELIGSVLDMDATSVSQSFISPVYAVTSFPVDVVVFIRVDPSIMRFNCLPASRVECLLQLPSVELVFSTKRADVESMLQMGDNCTPPTKPKVPKPTSGHAGSQEHHPGLATSKPSTPYTPPPSSTSSTLHPPTSTRGSSRHRPGSASADTSTFNLAAMSFTSPSGGGLSFSGCLSDFSLYIFHPYGGQRKANISSPLSPQGSQKNQTLGSIQEHMSTPLSDLARKDSLSLNVEFVKVNIARTRKLDVRQEGSTLSASYSSLRSDAQNKSNSVRLSAICDIGSASFKYDMRRLSEIMSFPKAWYRRNLARRMFLGDDSYGQTGAEGDWDTLSLSSFFGSESTMQTPVSKAYTSPNLVSDFPTPIHHPLPPPSHHKPRRTHHRRVSSGDKIKVQMSPELSKEFSRHRKKGSGGSLPQSPVDTAATASSPDGYVPITATPSAWRRASQKRRASSTSAHNTPDLSRQRSSMLQASLSKQASTWETLVLFAVNLSQLDVNVNMSNVMGNTMWSTKDLKCQGRLDIDSTGHKNMKISAGFAGTTLDSKGGIISGAVDLQDLNAFFHASEDPAIGHEPDHQAGLSLYALEARLDYMGSSVLMTRSNDLSIKLRDEWSRELRPDPDKPRATIRPAIIFVHMDFRWDQFHLMISRSTTGDFIKMYAKMEEFLTNQFASSRRVLSAFGPIPVAIKARTSTIKGKISDDLLSELCHHRHWQRVLEDTVGCQFSMLPCALPEEGTILGGTATLKGNNLSLACFQGINFRSKSWAVFCVNEPNICFATEAQCISDEDPPGTHIVQNLTFHIGHDTTQRRGGGQQNMATVVKLSRGHFMPPPFTSVQDWFHYVLATPEIKVRDSFPPMQRRGSESPTENVKKSRKGHDYNHDTEVVFQLPCIQLHLITEHLQGLAEPAPDDPPAIVECSFITEFEGHMLVAMDAEVLLFLHDLISSYIKEKDRGSRPSAKTPESEKKLVDPTLALKQDMRKFICKTWHLEPTVRLFHWASKQIDPVGADYVLQKLGFSHARETIPKWMQRGFMDPLDKVLSMLVDKLIRVLRENPSHQDSPDDGKT